MKKIIMLTTVHGNRGPQKVITHGYRTKVPGLSVIRDVHTKRDYWIMHTKTGLSLGNPFATSLGAIKFANKYLIDLDFIRSANKIRYDDEILKRILDAEKSVREAQLELPIF